MWQRIFGLKKLYVYNHSPGCITDTDINCNLKTKIYLWKKCIQKNIIIGNEYKNILHFIYFITINNQ